MAQISQRILAILSDISVFAYHLRWKFIPKTDNGLQKIQIKKQQLHVAGYCNAAIALHKVIPFRSQHLNCFKYKNTISRIRLNLSLFKNYVSIFTEHIIEFLPCDCRFLFEVSWMLDLTYFT